ncbi:MAG: stage III sporulation protein AF [Clostridia bacterium]|nr:stage III sporulation protein AF [Clostridia bacterium]
MKAYIISIAVATVISAVVSMITPEKWSKYVSIVTGLVVTVCIAQPIISLVHADVFEGFSYKAEQSKNEGEKVLYGQIKTELEKRIANDAKKRLETEFGKKCEVYTAVEMTTKGEVAGVRTIQIYGEKIDAVAIGRLREVYGAEEVKYIGYKKTAQKPE